MRVCTRDEWMKKERASLLPWHATHGYHNTSRCEFCCIRFQANTSVACRVTKLFHRSRVFFRNACQFSLRSFTQTAVVTNNCNKHGRKHNYAVSLGVVDGFLNTVLTLGNCMKACKTEPECGLKKKRLKKLMTKAFCWSMVSIKSQT